MTKAVCVLLILLSLSLIVWPLQRQRRPDTFPDLREEFTRRDNPGKSHHGEYTFARLRYSSSRWRDMWTTDYPKADAQLLMGLRNWVQSSLDLSDDATTVPPALDELVKYPFIYAVEPGFMELTTEHAAQLREYLLRGGFWMLDDFWGEYEWQNVQEQLHKVFPEYEIKELSLDHPIFHCYYDITWVAQVPNGPRYIRLGITHEKGGIVPHYMGITNEEGRVMVFIARNMDNGDAWEWIDDPKYPLKYGLAAYRLGMNLIVYAMTH